MYCFESSVHLLVFALEEIALISVFCFRHLNAASHVRLDFLFLFVSFSVLFFLKGKMATCNWRDVSTLKGWFDIHIVIC